jgi:signal transduction histidine kinase
MCEPRSSDGAESQDANGRVHCAVAGVRLDRDGDLVDAAPRMSYRLHSTKLQHLGLATATKSLCQELSRQHNVRIDFIQDNVPRMSDDVALCLFRVAQEALTNAIKYAGVQDVSVALRCT